MAQVQKSAAVAAAVVVQSPTAVSGTSCGQCSNAYYHQEGEYSKLMINLREKLLKTRKETDDWANSRRRVVRESGEGLKDMIKESDVQTKELRAKIDAAEHRRLENIQLQANHVSEMDKLKKEVHELRMKIDEALPREIGTLEERRERMNQQLKEKQIQKKKVQEEKEDGLEVLARGITLYKLIGLDFEQIQDEEVTPEGRMVKARLRLIFTQIDATSPERQFCFTICVNEVNQYEIMDCYPILDSCKVDSMLEDLNQSNDFSIFVGNMRTAFVQIAGSDAEVEPFP